MDRPVIMILILCLFLVNGIPSFAQLNNEDNKEMKVIQVNSDGTITGNKGSLQGVTRSSIYSITRKLGEKTIIIARAQVLSFEETNCTLKVANFVDDNTVQLGDSLILLVHRPDNRSDNVKIQNLNEREPGQSKEYQTAPKLYPLALQYGYFHLGMGGGFSIASSSDIETAIDPFEMYPVSVDKYFDCCFGLRNFVQVEYRSNKSNHDFHFTEPTLKGGQITREGLQIPMQLTFKEWLFKINPFFKVTDPRLAIFFIYGTGNVENLDDEGDGFKNGSESVYGLEIGYLVKYLSASVALEYRNIAFKQFELQDFGSLSEKFGMGYFIIGVKVNIGLGK